MNKYYKTMTASGIKIAERGMTRCYEDNYSYQTVTKQNTMTKIENETFTAHLQLKLTRANLV